MQTTCQTFLADAGSYTDMKSVITQLINVWGHIDILVNNAGIASLGLFTDMSPTDYSNIITTDLLSVLHCCHIAVPFMVSRRRGRIINISSVWGVAGASCEAAYSAAKGGINSFTKALAKELAPSGIAVKAVPVALLIQK